MAKLRWTKFQDFYLRLGFLKVLAGTLDSRGRSAANDVVVRSLQELMFAPARSRPALWERLGEKFPWALEQLRDRRRGQPRGSRPLGEVSVARALLLVGNCPSQGYAITRETSYKILDWGRDLRLLASGNQITESGVVLQSLLPRSSVSLFRSKDPMAWNPFVIDERERLFFLFHLCEVDKLTIDVVDELDRSDAVGTIESAQAARMTCVAFLRLLKEAREQVGPTELPALRRGRELAEVIARELGLEAEAAAAGFPLRNQLSILARAATDERSRFAKPSRRTTKNADHQTIPRFEQLVDLGFLSKPSPGNAESESVWEARSRWRYERLPVCSAWSKERRSTLDGEGPWEWRGFARAALGSGLVSAEPRRDPPSVELIARFLWTAYEAVHRPIGHTPFHSVGMIAMIDAVTAGFAVEIRDFHALLLEIKAAGRLTNCVSFASGNEIDKMFVLLRPGFVEAVTLISGELRPHGSA